MRRIALFVTMALSLVGTVYAQTGGQFCLQAFEDRNANGQQDAGEPVLTRGISINLLNEQGIVIQSATLENSPRASFGEYCFQLLPAGQYSVVVTSADYRATTPDTIAAAISESGTPALVQFGGQRASTGTPVSSPVVSAQQQREQLAQLVLAGLGALIVIAVMVVLGVIVYFAAFRSRLRAASAADARRTTGSMRAARATDTGEIPRSAEGSE